MWEEHVPQEKTEAVVLRGVDFSNTSRIVTFLSPLRGRLACIAKGVKRKGSRLAGVLDTFNRLELVYYRKEGRSIQTLGEVSLLDGFSGIKTDLEKATLASFPLELAYKTARENEPSEVLYATLVSGLADLSAWRGDVKTHVCWQAFWLLSSAGFQPLLDHCVRCGGPVDAAPGFAYDGGVTCQDCGGDRRLSEEAYVRLRSLASSAGTCPAGAGMGEVLEVLGLYGSRQLETDFRSLRVIRQVFG